MLQFVPTVIMFSKPEICLDRHTDFMIFLYSRATINFACWFGITGIISLCSCRERQFSRSWFKPLVFIFTWLGGGSLLAVGPCSYALFVLASVFCGTQSPVTFLGSFGPPFENSAGESHLSCQQGTACCALHLMALYKMQ